MEAQNSTFELTIEITRKDTGTVETYTVLCEPEQQNTSSNGDNK